MRIAYLINWELSTYDGVSKKVYAQTHEWLSLGHDVQVFCISQVSVNSFGAVPVICVNKASEVNIINQYISNTKAYHKIFSFLKEYKPDILYFRFDIYQPSLKEILSSFPTVIEMNSNDLEEFKLLAKEGFRGKIRYLYHILVRKSFFNAVKGFCCVTNEIAELPSIRKFNKPTFVIANAIKSEKFVCEFSGKENKLPRLVFMGSPKQAWHGVDKIIELAFKTQKKLEFDIIGSEAKEYKQIPPNVTFHGYLDSKEYEQILCRGNIGICTLALHRKNMQEASPLKTREYLAYGLPIILGYIDTAFIGSRTPDWVLPLPNDEDNVNNNIDAIVEFCYKNANRRITKAETFNYIDSSVLETRRLSHLEQIAHIKNPKLRLIDSA